MGVYIYDFINPAIVLRPEANLAPFFLDFSAVYNEYFTDQATVQIEDNVAEWTERFCDTAPPEDIHYVVYESTINELLDLRAAISNKNISLQYLGGRLANNLFVRHLYRHRCVETIDYLVFAKRCQPHVVARNSWENDFVDEGAMRGLIRDAQQAFLTLESHYIKLRYAYQAIRLAHYLKDYELTLELWEYYMPKIDNEPSIIEYWIIGHRAGALLALGKNVEASYLYSRIFEQCPSKRESAYRSFHITSDEEWERCLLYCKNDHERATLYVLRAQSPNARLVEEMNNVYQLAPTHSALELLLVREMQQLEKDLLGEGFNPYRQQNRQYYGIPRPEAGQRVIELQAFVRKVMEEGKVTNLPLWKIAEGYLEMLAGDYYFAKQTFEEAEAITENEALREQLAVFRLVMEILALTEVNETTEEQIGRFRRNNVLFNKYPAFNDLTNDKLRYLYAKQGDMGKAFLLAYNLKQLRVNPQFNVINSLLEISAKEAPTAFEQTLIVKPDGENITNDLLDLKASVYLSQFQLEAALEIYRAMPRANWDEYGLFNPFVERMKDCVNCLLPDSMQLYNKADMMQEMLDMEYEARAETDPDLAALTFFRLGVAYYNLSYFSYGWKATDFLRSGASARRAYRQRGQTVFPQPGFPLGNQENFDCSRAQFYFDKARSLAQDPEISARATFWAAKCERNRNYVETLPAEGPSYVYFQILRDNYAETDYYQRAIRECKYFQAYVAR